MSLQAAPRDEAPANKKLKLDEAEQAEVPVEAARDTAGDAYFHLSDKRRVTVRTFKSKILVDIREMYEKDEKLLPGKKGISLSKEQYEVLRDLVMSGAIDKQVADLENK